MSNVKPISPHLEAAQRIGPLAQALDELANKLVADIADPAVRETTIAGAIGQLFAFRTGAVAYREHGVVLAPEALAEKCRDTPWIVVARNASAVVAALAKGGDT